MPDLVIGGRRSAFPRPWRAAGIALALLGVVLVVAWFIYRRSVAYEVPDGSVTGEIVGTQSAPGAPPVLSYHSSSLEWLGGIAVLRTQGESHAIGGAHGRLLAPLIAPVVRAAKPSIEATVTDEGLLGGLTHNMRLAWRWRFIDDGLSDGDRRVIAGMTRGAAASGVSLAFEDVLRSQAVLDVGVPSRRSGEIERHSIAHSLTVLAQQAQTPARVWIGRTFALSGLDDGGDSAVPVVSIVKPSIELLAGIPSVVYGFIGVAILVPFIRDHLGGPGLSVLASSIVLGVMMLPTITSISVDALRSVPPNYVDGSVALGATEWQTTHMVVLKAARPGIVAAVILGMGRAIGETMAVIMVAGNTLAVPRSVLDPVRTLTSNIALEMGYASGDHRRALFATGVVLFVIIMILNSIALTVSRRRVGAKGKAR